MKQKTRQYMPTENRKQPHFFYWATVFSFLGIMILGVIPAVAQMSSAEMERPKVAVVLSGGGAKGFAHIGVLKILEQEGIPIDIIVGTSMGNLIGGIYSLGYTADEIENLVESQDWEQVLSDNVARKNLPFNAQIVKQRYQLSFSVSDIKSIGLPQGFIKGQNILNIFCGLAGNVPADADFSKFPISFACVAADLKTGKEVVINNGFFPTAMFASMAIPGVFQPAKRGDHILVDGGAVNNFPTDVAKKMGADIIIGVDIRRSQPASKELEKMDGIISRMVDFLGQAKDSVNNSLCDIIIKPDITGYSVGSFTKEAADSLILRGERAAIQQKDQLEELKKKYNLHPRKISRNLVVKDNWSITEINFAGNYTLDKTFLKDKLNMELPGSYSNKQIKSAIDRLYGYGGFDLVYYNLTNNKTGKTLNLNIIPQKEYSQQIGFKANTNDAAAILLNFTRKNHEKTFEYLAASAELSANPGFNLLAETNKRDLPTLGFELKTKYQKYNIYEKGKKQFNANIFYSAFNIYLYKSYLNKLNLGLGIQEEYFNGDVFSKDNNTSLTALEADQLITDGYVYITFDDWDDFYFPTKGTSLNIQFSTNTDFSKGMVLNPVLLFKMNKVVPIQRNTALLIDLYSRSLFSEDYPLIKTTVIGGEAYSQYFNYHLPFVGIPPVMLSSRYTHIGLIGLRIKIAKTQYFSVLYNMLVQGNNYKTLNGLKTTGGGGIKYSMNTIIGPIDIGLGYAKQHKKPTFSANMGFWF